jgi:hypothetical protein
MADRNFSAADVTVAVLNYNGIDKIPDLFASIRKLEHQPAEVVMVDDGSTDSSPDWVARHYPGVRIIRMEKNTGRLNLVRNRALANAGTDLVFIVDNDVVLLPDCLDRAVEAMNTLPDAVACMPRAVYDDRPRIIYQDGQILHYVGASPNINRDRDIAEADTEPRLSIGWGVQLIDRERTREFGWFNEEYLLGWGDDGEFNHKLNLAGLKCYNVPASVVMHNRHAGSKRYYSAVRNRWRFILEMYALKTLVLALPALLIYECALFFFLVMKGAVGQYFKGMKDTAAGLGSTLRERKKIQARRKVPDRELMTGGDIFIYSDEIGSPLLIFGYRVMNAVLNLYWKLIRNLL